MRKQRVPSPPRNWSEFLKDDLLIESMKAVDLDQVMVIENQSFATPWSRSYFLQEIQRNPLSCPFVLKKKTADRDCVVGFCVSWIIRDELHVNNVAVHPAYRTQGYGELLLRHVLAFGESRGCRKAMLEVRVSNRKAIQLYQKLGFRIIGEAPRYYEDNDEDAFILFRELPASP